MRINKYLAQATGVSRRKADELIQMRKIRIGQRLAKLTDHVTSNDEVYFGKTRLGLPLKPTLVMLNKPIGYVSSRQGQGSKTVYDLLPSELHTLKTIGRLDKDSSGLLLLTDDGGLANELMHPRYAKTKSYLVTINRPLSDTDKDRLEKGVILSDGISQLKINNCIASQQKVKGKFETVPDSLLKITMQEGRNRQIRRTFSKLGYRVVGLHRISFGDYTVGNLKSGSYKKLVST